MHRTATSTRAITPSKTRCAASYPYEIPHCTCVLNIRRPMRACLHTTNCTIFTVSVGKVLLRACSSAFEPSVQAYPKVQIHSITLAVKLCCRSVASSTLAVKLCCRSVASSTLAVKLCCRSVASSTLRCDNCRSFEPFEWVKADTLAVFSISPVDGSS